MKIPFDEIFLKGRWRSHASVFCNSRNNVLSLRFLFLYFFLHIYPVINFFRRDNLI